MLGAVKGRGSLLLARGSRVERDMNLFYSMLFSCVSKFNPRHQAVAVLFLYLIALYASHFGVLQGIVTVKSGHGAIYW